MPDTRKIVKVFLASPGDLSDERKTAKNVVDEFNSLHAEEYGFQVELSVGRILLPFLAVRKRASIKTWSVANYSSE
jgi:hypothetical protein